MKYNKHIMCICCLVIYLHTMATATAIAGSVSPRQNPVLPLPQKYTAGKGHFRMVATGVRTENKAGDMAHNIYSRPWLACSNAGSSQVMIFDTLDAATFGDIPITCEQLTEAYQLKITPDTLLVRAASACGFIYAWATIRQIWSDKGVSCCEIIDAPAFSWRSMMLDVSRHFRSVSFLKRQIDAMARYKFNRLHLHLTDAAGWRMEIKRYPRLTQTAAWRPEATWQEWTDNGCRDAEEGTPGAYGGYYTQDEMRSLVEYAEERGITIVPEIEMPGHSEEVLAAYPELSCTRDSCRQADFCPGSVATYDFLENVLTEVMSVFPSEYIHVGGDEAGKLSWGDCRQCRRMMNELHTGKDGLQAYMISHFAKFLKRHGRRLVGWDEVTDTSLPSDATVMVWRETDLARQAIRNGNDVVLSPGAYCYIDSYQDAPATQPAAMGGYLPLEKVYGYNPYEGLTADERRHVKGVQANLWAEYIPSDGQMEYMFWPRALAIAEIGWNGTARKNYVDFRRRTVMQCDTLRAAGINAFNLTREKGERKEALSPVSHKARGCTVIYNTPLNPKYTAGGTGALVDGVRGGWTYTDKKWQGFTGTKGWCLDITIDMGSITRLSEVSAVFMQSLGPWVYYPSEFRVSLSQDGKTFSEVYSYIQSQCDPSRVGYRTLAWHGSHKARYVRVQGSCNREGGWLFTDEIVVR